MKAPIRTALLFLLLAGLALAACGQPSPTPPPAHTIAPTSEVYIPSLENGEAGWQAAQCGSCHGPLGLGGIGPQLASTTLSYDEFQQAVRQAVPPKPAYDETQLPNQTVYDIYAWVRTQIPPAKFITPPACTPTTQLPSSEDMLGMTIWTCKKCNTCHGVFAQGSADAPALAGLNYPVEEELDRMRSTAETIPEHGVDFISKDTFEKLYKWLTMGCLQDECYH